MAFTPKLSVAGHHSRPVGLASWWLVWARPATLLPLCCPLIGRRKADQAQGVYRVGAQS
jgi:hypothetical protein